MKRKKFMYATLVVVALSTVSIWKTYAVSVEIPNGTVVIGTKAFDLSYANDPKNLDEIALSIAAGGEVYVKGFDAAWIRNTTSETISPSIIPSLTYKNSAGIESKYLAEDKVEDSSDLLEITIE